MQVGCFSKMPVVIAEISSVAYYVDFMRTLHIADLLSTYFMD